MRLIGENARLSSALDDSERTMAALLNDNQRAIASLKVGRFP
jgi:hypothetical protein